MDCSNINDTISPLFVGQRAAKGEGPIKSSVIVRVERHQQPVRGLRSKQRRLRNPVQQESDIDVLVVQCTKCRQKYALPEQAAGSRKECRKCGEPIDVPRRKYDLPVPVEQRSLSLPKLNYPNASQPGTRSQNPLFHIGPHVLAMSAGATILTIAFLVTRSLWYTPPIAPQPPESVERDHTVPGNLNETLSLPKIELPDPDSFDSNQRRDKVSAPDEASTPDEVSAPNEVSAIEAESPLDIQATNSPQDSNNQ